MPRTLVLLWGPPASGKSSLVTELELDPYVVSYDRTRALFAPSLPAEGGSTRPMPFRTVQQLAVQATHMQAESLMSLGSLVVVDNTNLKARDRRPWLDLAKKYLYDVIIVDTLGDDTVDELVERDRYRIGPGHVGRDVVERKHAEALKNLSGENSFWSIEDFKQWLDFSTRKANRVNVYHNSPPVHVVGDIHSHAEPLRNAMATLDPDQQALWVFLGDLFDRGPDPVGVYDLVRNFPNKIILVGNHDQHLMRLDAATEDTGKGLHQTRDTLAKLRNENRSVSDLYKWAEPHVTVHNWHTGTRYYLSHGGVPPEHHHFLAPDHLFVFGYGSREDTYRGGSTYRSMGDLSISTNEYVIHGHRKYDRVGNTLSLDTEGNGTIKVASLWPDIAEPVVGGFGYDDHA